MSKHLITLALLVATFTLAFGATEAEARHGRNRRNRCCRQAHVGQQYHPHSYGAPAYGQGYHQQSYGQQSYGGPGY